MSKVNEVLTPVQKVQKLEYAVINSSPEEIAEVYAEVGSVEYSARALAVACRFRGVDCVRALVEGGASFDAPFTQYMFETYDSYYDDLPVILLDNFPDKSIPYFYVTPKIYKSVKRADGTALMPLPFDKRVETADYLCEHGEKAGFVPGDLLYYAILFKDEPMTAELKKRGVKFSEYRRKMLIEKGKPKDLSILTCLLERLSAENFAPVLSRLSEELGGEKFHNTKGIYDAVFDKLYLPENLKAYLDHFDKPTPNKTEIMKSMIDKNSPEGLAFAESVGWLKQPKKRDEMIQYAAEHKSAECSAWLLDFKNRTADLAAERAKADKKQERELNASPDSAAVLKTLWTYKKREDGTLIINSYKGNRTEITVPAKIGKSPVTAIANGAFSPFRNRVIVKNGRFLKTITSITLPESVTEIGANAFDECCSLSSINIPEGVTEIPMSAFSRTAIESIVLPSGLKTIERYAFFECAGLKSIVIPEGVAFIGFKAFAGCTELETVELPGSLAEIEIGDTENKQIFSFDDKLTVIVPRGSYAEEYCKEHKIHYVPKGDQ